jgi:hypothetical protein
MKNCFLVLVSWAQVLHKLSTWVVQPQNTSTSHSILDTGLTAQGEHWLGAVKTYVNN